MVGGWNDLVLSLGLGDGNGRTRGLKRGRPKRLITRTRLPFAGQSRPNTVRPVLPVQILGGRLARLGATIASKSLSCKPVSARVRLQPGSVCLDMFVNGLAVTRPVTSKWHCAYS